MSDAVSARIFDGVLGAIDLLGMKRWRARTSAAVQGTVLEIGAGGGRNANWFPPGTLIIALDPDFELLKIAQKKTGWQGAGVVAIAEALPFKDAAFDCALATLVLCSVTDLHKVATELKRTLRPGGSLHAIDHVVSKAPAVRRAQCWLAAPWYRLTGSCRIERETLEVLRAEGFRVAVHDTALRSVLVRYEALAPVTTDAGF
ncbi:MAG: class I SAM-dependent methyltransferase [Actinobacteria bacterium]|nr:class I SAM-dependent methyltransferase [Actinomycetota bacterium]